MAAEGSEDREVSREGWVNQSAAAAAAAGRQGWGCVEQGRGGVPFPLRRVDKTMSPLGGV